MATTVYPLSQNEAAFGGFTQHCVSTFADWDDNATTNATYAMLTLGAGHVIRGVSFKVSEAITGAASVTQVTMNLGINGTTNTWFGGVDVHGGSKVDYGISNTALALTTTSTIVLQLVTTGESHDSLTAGKIEVFVDVADLSKLS